jgi:biopolymer transport protein TolQ
VAVNGSIVGYFWQASLIVKVVLFILLAASVLSWTYIIQRSKFLKQVKVAMAAFEEKIWKRSDLAVFYQELEKKGLSNAGMEPVFFAGFQEFIRVRKIAPDNRLFIMENVERAMRIANANEAVKFEENLSILATIGSISPYVGLFGTVWGIMMAFQGLSGAEQVTIAMVAPGIAEALIATAVGLFAAIPAVIAYNRLSHNVDGLLVSLDRFQERFSMLLTQGLYAGQGDQE